MRRADRSGMVAAVALLGVLCAIPATTPTTPPAFAVERAFACRTYAGDTPGEAVEEFAASEGVAYVWFEGAPVPRVTGVSAVVYQDDRQVATFELKIPRDSCGGVLSIRLTDRPVLPVGEYRVQLAAPGSALVRVWFRVVPGSAMAHAGAAGERIDRSAEGYSLTAHRGWSVAPNAYGALFLVRDGETNAGMLVLTELADGPVDERLAVGRARLALEDAGDVRLVRTSSAEIQGRPATTLILDCADGTRQKHVLIDREMSGRKVLVHALVLSATRAGFAEAEAEFDAMVASFRMGPRMAP